MKIVFTRHAKNRMRWRRINRDEVESVIDEPDQREYIDGRKWNLHKNIGKKNIRVTIVLEGDKQVIISVVDKND